jgi:hypothetical protein
VKPLALTPFILFSIAVALPACQTTDSSSVGAAMGAQVTPPASCSTVDSNNTDPFCNIAIDYPVQADLTIDNSQNIEFDVSTNQIRLEPGSGLLVDDDGDGVPNPADDCAGPGWRLPCDGDPSNDGVYQTLFFKDTQEATVQADLAISGSITSADAYILMDATGSMGGEQVQLLNDLTTGTFIPTGQCPSASGTGLVGALRCSLPDLWLGVGDFKDVGYMPHADPYEMTPYHHYLDTTDNLQHIIDAVAQMRAQWGRDQPEAATQAIYSAITGLGLGDSVPNRGACPSAPAGRWGYPCFRPGVLPIIMVIGDAEMWNGPRLASPTYGYPPFDGVVGSSTRLPPVEQSPNVLYSSDPFTAWDLGDLTSKSMTVMGSTKNMGNDAQTWDKGVCRRGSYWSGYWGDGRDAFVNFSVSASTDMFVSGQGTNYPTTNVALFDSALGYVTCNGGPGGGDYWGRFTRTFSAGDWYVVSDGAVDTSSSVSERLGNFQIRLHNQTADPGGYPSWETASLPIPWTTVEAELLARNVNIVGVVSTSVNGDMIGLNDMIALAVATGSVDQDGNPYVETINGDGSGLSTAIIDAMRSLVGNTRRDISFVPEDNAATTAVDETLFVTNITASSCPTNGLNNCLGGTGTPVCNDCLQGAEVSFQFRLGNNIVAQDPTTPQVFDFEMVGYAGAAEIGRIPIRVLVPEAGDGSYGSGYYQNTYDSDVVCEMPPERPDWGTLTWIGSTPSDSSVEFELYTANTLAELDTVIPVSFTYSAAVGSPLPNCWYSTQSYDVGCLLIEGGKENWMPFLRVRAKLNASSDSLSTPAFTGWSMQFECVPFD